MPGGGRRSSRAGVTLMEMMLVVTLIGLVAAISFPAVNSGIDSIRINAASDAIVAIINRGENMAERRQQAVEVAILRSDNAVLVRSVDASFERRLNLPEGVRIDRILPENPNMTEGEKERSYILFPGGTVPRFGIDLINRRGAHRIVRVDPITGVPQVETPQ